MSPQSLAYQQIANPRNICCRIEWLYHGRYVVGCPMEGIELEELRIETEGDIDLRGFWVLIRM